MLIKCFFSANFFTHLEKLAYYCMLIKWFLSPGLLKRKKIWTGPIFQDKSSWNTLCDCLCSPSFCCLGIIWVEPGSCPPDPILDVRYIGYIPYDYNTILCCADCKIRTIKGCSQIFFGCYHLQDPNPLTLNGRVI